VIHKNSTDIKPRICGFLMSFSLLTLDSFE